LNLAKL
jgi:DNA repair exonuclease SbcCD ATPase subunit